MRISLPASLTAAFLAICLHGADAQSINANGCTLSDFGINAGLYSGTTFSTGTVLPPAGSVDWFKATGSLPM